MDLVIAGSGNSAANRYGVPDSANIRVIDSRSLPVIWEYHRNTRKVFVIELKEGKRVQQADLIAEGVRDDQEATQIARAWRHGYATRDGKK